MSIQNELDVIRSATDLDGLYFNGAVQKRPEDCLSRCLLSVWESISDLFANCSSRQSLENRVIEVLYCRYTPENKEDINKIVTKLKLGFHFNLYKEVSEGNSIKFDRTLKKAELAWLRRDVGKAGGATGGTYYVSSLRKQRIGVFKSSESQSFLVKIKQYVKSFFGQRSYLNMEPMAEAQAEVATHELDKMLNPRNKLTVQSKVVEFNGVKGCFQSYAKDVASEEAKKAWLKKENYSPKEKEIFQRFAVMDYAIGNLDRHQENWFVKLDKHGNLERITAIDNANTFPKRAHSSKSFFSPPANQYAWGEEDIASYKMEESVIRWIQSSFCETNRKKMVSNLENHPDLTDFLTPEMKTQFLNRMKVLYELSLKPGFFPSLLMHLCSDAEIDAVINK